MRRLIRHHSMPQTVLPEFKGGRLHRITGGNITRILRLRKMLIQYPPLYPDRIILTADLTNSTQKKLYRYKIDTASS